MSETNGIIVQTPRGPSIKGTRLTIYYLMEYLKDGWTPKHTAQWFDLTPEEMDEVMVYLKANGRARLAALKQERERNKCKSA